MNALTVPNSLWQATAGSASSMPALAGNERAGVCVVGAGYTGLSAALHLAEAGADVVLVDAVDIGFGASGRNGGQIIPGLKLDLDELRERFGSERGELIARACAEAPSFVMSLIERHGIAADAVQRGWINAAHCDRAMEMLERRAAQWAALGDGLHMLDGAELQRYTGSSAYPGGLLDRRGGSLNPLSYARGLGVAAVGAGARLYRAVALEIAPQGTRWRVRTEHASIDAEQVVLATNAYSDLAERGGPWRGLAQTVIPVNSFQIATTPLPSHLRAVILPHQHVVSDTRRLLAYFRLDTAGRFIMGGRGGFSESNRPEDYAHIRAMMHAIYPELRGITIDFRWGGRVALTRDHMPHLHRLAPGVFAALGYNGRGVAMASYAGALLGQLAAGVREAEIPLPVSPLKRIPFHGLRRPVIALAASWKRMLDRRDAASTSRR